MQINNVLFLNHKRKYKETNQRLRLNNNEIYYCSLSDSKVQLWITEPHTILERQGGRSLKTSNLLEEEWQWAQKAPTLLGICTPFHSSVCVCVWVYQLGSPVGFPSSKYLNNLTIRGQILLSGVTSGLHCGSVYKPTNYWAS